MRLLAEQLLYQLLDRRHSCLSADQHHFVDLAGVDAGILQRLLRRPNRLLQQIIHQRFELRPGQIPHQVLRPARVGSNKRQVDLRLLRRRQLNLRLLRRVLQPLQRHLVALGVQVQPGVGLELADQPVHNALVEIIAAQMRIAVGRLHLDDAFANFQNRNIERAAAEVVHGNGLVLLLVQPIGQRRRSRLIHNALDVETRNLAGVFCRLPLRVVEVRRHGDDRLGHTLAQVVLRRLLQLLQDHRRNLRRRVLLALRNHRDVVALGYNLVRHHLQLVANLVHPASHKPLDGVNRVLRVGNRLTLGHLAHQPLSALRKRNNRWRRPATLFVRDHLRLAAFHHGNAAIRRSQIDSNRLSHARIASLVCHSLVCHSLVCHSLVCHSRRESASCTAKPLKNLLKLSACACQLAYRYFQSHI